MISNADMTGEEEKLHLWPSPVFEPRQGSGMIYAINSNEDARSLSAICICVSKDVTQIASQNMGLVYHRILKNIF